MKGRNGGKARSVGGCFEGSCGFGNRFEHFVALLVFGCLSKLPYSHFV